MEDNEDQREMRVGGKRIFNQMLHVALIVYLQTTCVDNICFGHKQIVLSDADNESTESGH